ncbi:MAG: hypothetical protein OES79_14615 [Planctomycetota bacterium]|nr:hypothetical protein [Planctomycetota bacterium]
MQTLTDLSKELGYSPSAGYLATLCREHGMGKRLGTSVVLTKTEAARLRRLCKRSGGRGRPRGK